MFKHLNIKHEFNAVAESTTETRLIVLLSKQNKEDINKY